LPYDILTKPRKTDYILGENYAAELLARLQITYEQVHQHQDKALEKSKVQFDKRAADSNFSLGDVVYMKNYALKQGINRKFQRKFLGPYYITKRIGEASYEIKESYGRKTEKVHSDRLRKALKPGAPFTFEWVA